MVVVCSCSCSCSYFVHRFLRAPICYLLFLLFFSRTMQVLGDFRRKATMTYIAVTSTTDDWVHIIFYTQYAVAAPPKPNFNFHTHTPFLYSFSIFFASKKLSVFGWKWCFILSRLEMIILVEACMR